VTNAFNTPRRLRIALALYALAAIAPGWGTFNNWIHDELLVEGFAAAGWGCWPIPTTSDGAGGRAAILLFLASAAATDGRCGSSPRSRHRLPGRDHATTPAAERWPVFAIALFALLSRRKAIAHHSAC